MPRGSDAAAAGAELQARTGFKPNAEEMIKMNQGRISRELRAASNRSVDRQATDEMDESEAQGLVEGEGTVVSWAVRGPFVVLVVEDDKGALRKEAHPRKGKEKQAERATRQGTGGAPAAQSAAKTEERPEERPASRRRSSSSPPATANE